MEVRRIVSGKVLSGPLSKVAPTVEIAGSQIIEPVAQLPATEPATNSQAVANTA
jgi:hypothetical protein